MRDKRRGWKSGEKEGKARMKTKRNDEKYIRKV